MSQQTEILHYLRKGKSITPLEALQRFGSLRLGARIYGLRQQGHKIKRELVRCGRKCFARYSLA